MASKGMKNLFGSLFGSKPRPVPAVKEPVDPNRQQKQALPARLRAMDVPPEVFRELQIPGLLRWAASRLEALPNVCWAAREPEEKLDGIIRVLDAALRERLPMTAEYACAALVCAIGNLYAEIPDPEQKYADELTECRTEYVRKLRELATQCMEVDRLDRELEKMTARRQEKRREMDALKADYTARRDAGALDNLLAELACNAPVNPADLSDGALELHILLSSLQMCKAELIAIDADIQYSRLLLNNRKTEVESLRCALSEAPLVDDPKLQERFNGAHKLYRESLRKELGRMEEELRSDGICQDKLTELMGCIINTYIILGPDPTLAERARELEKHQRLLAEMQAAETRARAQDNLEEMRKQLQELRQLLAQRKKT